MNDKVIQAIEQGRKLRFAWVRSFSEVSLGYVPEKIDLSTLIEARFFDDETEIRIFRTEAGWDTAQLFAAKDDSEIFRTYRIGNPKFGRNITVAQQLAEDEDGQVYIASLRLCHWEGGE